MGKQQTNKTALINLDYSHGLLNHRSCAWVRYCTRTRCCVFHICVCLFGFLSAGACSASLGEYASPGENYKEIRSLLVLDKICMGEKEMKRIDRQNNAPAGPEGTQHTLGIKNIHLYCFCKQEFCKWEWFSWLKATVGHFWFICLQSIRLRPNVPGGESFLNCYRIKRSPPSLTLNMINDRLWSLAR